MPFQQELELHSLFQLGPEQTLGLSCGYSPNGAKSFWGYQVFCWGSAFGLLLFLKVMGESWPRGECCASTVQCYPSDFGEGLLLGICDRELGIEGMRREGSALGCRYTLHPCPAISVLPHVLDEEAGDSWQGRLRRQFLLSSGALQGSLLRFVIFLHV